MQKISGTITMAGSNEALGSLDIAQTWVGGQSEPPALNLRAEIKLKPLVDRSKQQPTYRPITMLRTTGEFRSPEHRLLVRFQDDTLLFAHDSSYDATAQVTFEIPMDVSTIHRIEEERNGGNLRVGLRVRFVFALHGMNGVQTFQTGSINDLNFTIPRSEWVEEILPGLRYGGLEILEIRHGPGVIGTGLRTSLAEVKEARKYLAEGYWDKAALHCRMAVEGILTSKGPLLPNQRFEQQVNNFIGNNLPGIDDVEARLLADQMALIWHATSTAAHGTPQHPFKRPDAEFVIRATMAIVEYFSRLLR